MPSPSKNQPPWTGKRPAGPAHSLDSWGSWASALCVIHCLFTPVVLSLSAVTVHFLPSEEHTHRVLAIIVAAVGIVAVVRGFRRHRRRRVLWLAAFGLICIWGAALWGDQLAWHAAEVSITTVGSCAMIAAHRLNHTFCAGCDCSQ